LVDSGLLRGRYKVVRTLCHAAHYAAVEAVDIEARECPSFLVNLYEGELLHRYGEVYAQMEGCPEFCGMFLEGGRLAGFSRRAAQAAGEAIQEAASLTVKKTLPPRGLH